MNQAVTVSPKTIEEILAHLNALTSDIKAIKAKLFEKEPLYGSDEWWEWSERKADEDIKASRYKIYKDVKHLIKDLHAGR